jgi:hypothetical protein
LCTALNQILSAPKSILPWKNPVPHLVALKYALVGTRVVLSGYTIPTLSIARVSLSWQQGRQFTDV